MILFILTHGKHIKRGNTAHTYDGPLTDEAWADLAKITIPNHNKVYRGAMLRHKETARRFGLDESAEIVNCLGYDPDMFALLEGDLTMVTEMKIFLEKLKCNNPYIVKEPCNSCF